MLVDGLKCKEDVRLYEKHKVFSHVAALAGSAMLEPRAKVRRLGVMFERFADTRKMWLAGLCADQKGGGGGVW